LCLVAWLRGDFVYAESLGRRALEMLSNVGDREGTTWALINLGITARYREDLAAAEVLLRHSLELSEEVSYREGIAWSLNQLGVVSRLQGHSMAAVNQQLASMAEHRILGNRWRVASVYDELAASAVASGDGERAAAQLNAADQLRREIGSPLPTAEQLARDETVAAAKSLMGATFDAARLAAMARSPW
jgi:hypothetical protein